MFPRFDTIPECVRQTDGFAVANWIASFAARRKNYGELKQENESTLYSWFQLTTIFDQSLRYAYTLPYLLG